MGGDWQAQSAPAVRAAAKEAQGRGQREGAPFESFCCLAQECICLWAVVSHNTGADGGNIIQLDATCLLQAPQIAGLSHTCPTPPCSQQHKKTLPCTAMHLRIIRYLLGVGGLHIGLLLLLLHDFLGLVCDQARTARTGAARTQSVTSKNRCSTQTVLAPPLSPSLAASPSPGHIPPAHPPLTPLTPLSRPCLISVT